MKKWIKPILIISLGVLFARCDFLRGIYPLGIAFICVLYNTDVFYYAFVGGIAGAISLSLTLQDILLNTAPYAVALPILFLIKMLKGQKVIFTMCCALVSFVLPAFIVPIELSKQILLIFHGLLAMCLVPVLKRLYLSVLEIESRLSLEKADIMAICCIGGLVISSLPKTDLLGFNLCVFALLASSAVAVCAFEQGGSIWSSVCACMWVIKGGDVTVALCLVCGGIFAGLLSNKKGGALLGFVLGDLLISLFLLNMPVLSLGAVNLILGCGYTVLIKKEHVQRLKRLAGRQSGVNDLEMNYIELLRQRQKSKLQSAGRMYLELSKAFVSAERGREFKQQLVQAALGVCNACSKYEYCHKSRKSDTVLELGQAADRIIQTGAITTMPLSLNARCIQPINLVCAIKDSFDKLTLWQSENPTESGEMAAQLKETAQMLFALADDIMVLPEFDSEQEKLVTNVLGSRIENLSQVVCRKNGESHILQISVRDNRRNLSQLICDALEQGYVGKYRFLSGGTNHNGGFTGNFAPVSRLKVKAYACRSNKKGQAVCGDSYTFCQLENDKYIAAVSDGAGSGERAARESESALDLLEAFSDTSIQRKDMFKTMNRLLLLKGEEEAYSTMDVAELDLDLGVLYWTKIGAVPGYILRGNKVEKIDVGALPMGIVTKFNPITTKKLVQSGDVVVLVTDGVYDGLCVGEEDKITDTLIQAKEENKTPEKLAEEILSKAKATAVDDDMTVLVLKIDAA